MTERIYGNTLTANENMRTIITEMSEQLKTGGVVFLLVAFLVIEIITLPIVSLPERGVILPDAREEMAPGETILKISETDGPRIDDQAAMIVVAGPLEEESVCTTLPGHMWRFLLIALIVLLVFNFSYDFKRQRDVHFVWETVFLTLTLFAWYVWDDCRSATWFPLSVIKVSIIIFALYLYLFEKKERRGEQPTLID